MSMNQPPAPRLFIALALGSAMLTMATHSASAQPSQTALLSTTVPTTSVRSASRAGSESSVLPDADRLIERAIARIVAQDRPAGIPVAHYTARAFGRAESMRAVQRYSGAALSPAAFGPVAAWPDARGRDSLVTADSTALWLAITRLERGDAANQVFLWYTTDFAAPPAFFGAPARRERYAFCERWVRSNGTWRYEGFVKVVSE
jgi:hypothetical protein